MGVRAKKSLGQHFLTDHNIARKIVSALPEEPALLVEVGPGEGMLTQYILDDAAYTPMFIEADQEAVGYLEDRHPAIRGKLLHADFLSTDLHSIIPGTYQLAGNLPYNISSQIFFRMLEDRDRLRSAVVMVQKEVADRIRSAPGSKVYGILSVLLQTWFDIEYLFAVPPSVFRPPPKVRSAVIRLTRNQRNDIGCSQDLYFRVVKTAFNQRRKTLKNALAQFLYKNKSGDVEEFLGRRAEELGVEEFIKLSQSIGQAKQP